MDRVLVPLKEAFEAIGIGKTLGFELVKDGTIETVKLGRRTLAVAESLQTLPERMAARRQSQSASRRQPQSAA